MHQTNTAYSSETLEASKREISRKREETLTPYTLESTTIFMLGTSSIFTKEMLPTSTRGALMIYTKEI